MHATMRFAGNVAFVATAGLATNELLAGCFDKGLHGGDGVGVHAVRARYDDLASVLQATALDDVF